MSSETETLALHLVSALYEATGGRPRRCESLGNPGAGKDDAAGIAYAVERGWLLIAGGLHSLSRGWRAPVGVAASPCWAAKPVIWRQASWPIRAG
jgi:hypothetical protein